jgi:anti-sigma-K factor RskA
MNDIHALSGAYAVDALDDDERAEFERHLAVCADCRAEVASFRETTALLAEPEAETPPASLRAHVLSGIQAVRPLPPVPGNAGNVTTLRRRHLPQLLAAAAAIVLLAVGAVLWHPWSSSQASIADQVLHAPDAVRITEKVGHGPGELTLVRSASLKRAVLVGSHVPAAGSGKTYQMWLQQPGEGMVSAGLMPDADEPTLLTGDAATATAAAVSVEPDTGSAHPTSDPIALFPLKSASTGNDGT